MKRTITILAGLLASCVLAAPAFAHPGAGHLHGFVSGFLHPVSGVDHVLTMVAVGLFAAHLGGRALWLVPATFVALMTAGAIVGMNGAEIPFIETGVAASVVVLGLTIALRTALPVVAATSLVGVFAVFHGQAHGLETPAGALAFTYALGFVTATASLHLVGVGAGVALSKAGASISLRAAQLSGGAMAATGAFLLAGV